MTTWKKVAGLNYEVSSNGEVRNSKGELMNFFTNTQGYYQVRLGSKLYLVHRLVAEAFCDNPNNYSIVDHKDRNRTNNNASNLRWCTQSENLLNGDMKRHRRNEQVDQFDMDGKLIKTWKSATEAGKELNIFQQSISNCCNGKAKSTGGYKWAFHNNPIPYVEKEKQPRKKYIHSSEYLDNKETAFNEKYEAYKNDFYKVGLPMKLLRKKYGSEWVKDNPLLHSEERAYHHLFYDIEMQRFD